MTLLDGEVDVQVFDRAGCKSLRIEDKNGDAVVISFNQGCFVDICSITDQHIMSMAWNGAASLRAANDKPISLAG